MSDRIKKSICFIGLDSYPVISNSLGNRYIGGESVQISFLAKAFKELGYKVSVICGDYGQADEEIIDGIRIVKAFNAGPALPVIRFLYRRIYCFMKALKKVNADIYYQSCSGFVTGLVALHCRLFARNKIFIFRIASDADCIPERHISTKTWHRYLYNYGLRNAGIIAAQGIMQQKLLKKNYGLISFPVNMVVEEPVENITERKVIDLLWVGNIRKVKRPELVIELAKTLPEYRFVMIGGPLPSCESYYNEIKEKAEKLANIDFVGFVPYSKVNAYFEKTKILLNTSEMEGFPNTFLQAWIRKVPVISFFDPDGLIAKKNLGVAPNDIHEMRDSIRRLLVNTTDLEAMGFQCERFARYNYSPKAVAGEYESIIKEKLDLTN